MSTKKTSTESIEILGVRIDALKMAPAIQLITERGADRQAPAVYVTKPYVEFLAQAHKNHSLIELLNAAWLSLPDAVSLQWAAAYLAGPRHWWRIVTLGASIVFKPSIVRDQIPEKFAGANFTWKLLEACGDKGLRVYLIGSPHKSDISVTARTIKEKLPSLNLVGMWPGRLKGLSGKALSKALTAQPVEDALVADLLTKQPDIVLVGMGFPLQEQLMAKLAPQLKHGVLIGEGGTFDYDSFGGARRRAPVSAQNLGLEWLWRLLLEPKRLARQLAIPRFIWAVYRSR